MLNSLFVLLAAILWGMTGTAQTYLDEEASPIAVATIRSAIGGSLLLAITIIMRKINFLRWSWKWTILAAASIAFFQGLFF